MKQKKKAKNKILLHLFNRQQFVEYMNYAINHKKMQKKKPFNWCKNICITNFGEVVDFNPEINYDLNFQQFRINVFSLLFLLTQMLFLFKNGMITKKSCNNQV